VPAGHSKVDCVGWMLPALQQQHNERPRIAGIKLAIVGAFGGTHIGGSFTRAAVQLGIHTSTYDISEATGRNRLLRSLMWRFAGRRPANLSRFASNLIAACAKARPNILISTGAAPLTRDSLRALRSLNITCVNYSTDDPWNCAQRAPWYLRALPEYDVIFSARQANIGDFQRAGCRDVWYLPFGYDDTLFASARVVCDVPSHDVLFVGGADRDRVDFISAFIRKGPPVTLVGNYWDRLPALRGQVLGNLPPNQVQALTAAAKVNLCLVRRANRDDNVMRSFEIGAVGGCMIAEDTPGHRAIFGPDGEAAYYFRTPEEAAAYANLLIADSGERSRLSACLQDRIRRGRNTYRDRLATMIEIATGDHEREAVVQ
jgi:spore maturation protein CgeB